MSEPRSKSYTTPDGDILREDSEEARSFKYDVRDLRKAFAEHLEMVGGVLRTLAWVDSGGATTSDGTEVREIRKMFEEGARQHLLVEAMIRDSIGLRRFT